MDLIEKAIKKSRPLNKMYIQALANQETKLNNQLKKQKTHLNIFKGKRKLKKIKKHLKQIHKLQDLIKNKDYKHVSYGQAKLLLALLTTKKTKSQLIRTYKAKKMQSGAIYIFGVMYHHASTPKKLLIRKGTNAVFKHIKNVASKATAKK